MDTNIDSNIAEQDSSIPTKLLELAEIAYNAFFYIRLKDTPKFSELPDTLVNGWFAVASAVGSRLLEDVFGSVEVPEDNTKGCGNNCVDCECD